MTIINIIVNALEIMAKSMVGLVNYLTTEPFGIFALGFLSAAVLSVVINDYKRRKALKRSALRAQVAMARPDASGSLQDSVGVHDTIRGLERLIVSNPKPTRVRRTELCEILPQSARNSSTGRTEFKR